MVEGNHWDQWFSDGFGVRQPLVTMVFDGCAPLVRRWNGYVPSSKSTLNPEKPNQDDISKSNLIESVLATIGDVHKFDDLGLIKRG